MALLRAVSDWFAAELTCSRARLRYISFGLRISDYHRNVIALAQPIYKSRYRRKISCSILLSSGCNTPIQVNWLAVPIRSESCRYVPRFPNL